MMTHAYFVALAYALTAMTLLGLFVWLFVSGRRLRQRLRQLEQRRAAYKKAAAGLQEQGAE